MVSRISAPYVLLIGNVLMAPSLLSHARAMQNSPVTTAEPATTDSNTRNDEAIRQQKRKKVTVGFYVLCGIVLLGILTVLITMMMGHSVRRIARKPTSPSAPRDELWYLKSDKKTNKPDKTSGLDDSEPGS